MNPSRLHHLIGALMVAGEVSDFDMTDPWSLHMVVRQIAEQESTASRSVLSRFATTIVTKPDPDVGLRVQGLTKAIWDAVAEGFLELSNDGLHVRIRVTCEARTVLSWALNNLPQQEAECLYGAGAVWAKASADRKNVRNAPSVSAM